MRLLPLFRSSSPLAFSMPLLPVTHPASLRDKRRCLRPVSVPPPPPPPLPPFALQMGISRSTVAPQPKYLNLNFFLKKMTYIFFTLISNLGSQTAMIMPVPSKLERPMSSRRDQELELSPHLRVRTCTAVPPRPRRGRHFSHPTD